VEAFDAAGNVAVDSMRVTTANGQPSALAAEREPALVCRAYPNPGCGRAQIAFALPVPGWVGLSIYDALGRRVRELDAGCLPAGRHALAWDGRDARGAPVASGTYFGCLRAGTERRRVKLMLTGAR
jgi:hypothetical protein